MDCLRAIAFRHSDSSILSGRPFESICQLPFQQSCQREILAHHQSLQRDDGQQFSAPIMDLYHHFILFLLPKHIYFLWVLQTLIGIIGISIDNRINLSPYDGNDVLIYIGVALNILTIGMYALTYYRFKRSQVIYNLF